MTMKQFRLSFIITMMLSVACVKAYADFDTSTRVKVGKLYYFLDNKNNLAEVTDVPYMISYSYHGDIDIPSEIDYNEKKYRVTSIGSYAFYCCTKLSSVTIPEEVTNIGNSGFFNCTSITSIELPSKLLTIGESAFGDCTELKSIYIPESVTKIGQEAFIGCRNLISVNIPSGITEIANGLFRQCTYLPSITIPSNITKIGNDAFFQCMELASITIPSSVKSIGSRAFQGCYFLTSITIPSSVNSIGVAAFDDCYMITTFKINKETPFVVEKTFFNYRANATLYVPIGCKAAYEAEGFWNEFKEIIETDDFETGISHVSEDNPVMEVYTIDGKRIVGLQRGMNIIRTKDGKTRKVYAK